MVSIMTQTDSRTIQTAASTTTAQNARLETAGFFNTNKGVRS